MPRQTEKQFLLKLLEQKSQSLSEAVTGGDVSCIATAKLDLTKFIISNPSLVNHNERMTKIIKTLNQQLDGLDKILKETRLNEIAEALSKNRTWTEWLMELVHNVVKFVTFDKFHPFTEETNRAQDKDAFKDYFETCKVKQNSEVRQGL